MTGTRVKVGIVGLGRWAKVLTRAARNPTSIEIVVGLQPLGGEARGVPEGIRRPPAPDLATMLADPRSRA